MTYYLAEIDAQEWCSKNPGLRVKSLPCDCGHMVQTTVPLISEEWVGLTSDRCPECGCTKTVSTIIPRSNQKNEELKSLLNEIQAKSHKT
jgi:hypothetical protein